MTDEEGKSIELLKAQITLLKHGHNFETTDEYSRLSLKRIYEDVLNLIEKQNLKINKVKNQLENQIDFCKKENAHHYDICSINLRFNKGLLKILEE